MFDIPKKGKGLCSVYHHLSGASRQYIALRIQIYPFRKGFPRTNPMTWGWDAETINPTRNREGLVCFFFFPSSSTPRSTRQCDWSSSSSEECSVGSCPVWMEGGVAQNNLFECRKVKIKSSSNGKLTWQWQITMGNRRYILIYC